MASSVIVPDQIALRRVGAHVRKHLTANPKVEKVDTDKAELFAYRAFFTGEECLKLIRMIDATAFPSELYDQSKTAQFRTSSSGNLDTFDPFVKSVSGRIDALMGVKSKIGESIQGQRYQIGQQFKAHHDYFHTTEPYWPKERKRGGQRSWTAMAFLNPVTAGGETDFPHLGFFIKPQAGMLLLWNNADEDGVPNDNTLHAGLPVTNGTKYIITKWYRTRKWT